MDTKNLTLLQNQLKIGFKFRKLTSHRKNKSSFEI